MSCCFLEAQFLVLDVHSPVSRAWPALECTDYVKQAANVIYRLSLETAQSYVDRLCLQPVLEASRTTLPANTGLLDSTELHIRGT